MTDSDRLDQVLANHEIIIGQLRTLFRVCLGFGIGLVVLVVFLLRAVRGFRETADAKLTAMLALAESVRDNRKETDIAKAQVATKVEINTGKLSQQLDQVPHRTAEEVVQRIRDGDSGTSLPRGT